MSAQNDAKRMVTNVCKDSDGDITHLCNPNSYWSPLPVSEVIEDIELGNYTYETNICGFPNAQIHVKSTPNKKYLTTNPDTFVGNNLDELEKCIFCIK